MTDLETGHDPGHVHPPHPPIVNYVILSVVFLTITTIWGWTGMLRPLFSDLMCELTPVERINRDIPLSIVVSQFKHDESEQTKHVISALSRVLQPALAKQDAQIVHACNESQGRRMLKERGARLLVSGKVESKSAYGGSRTQKRITRETS